MIVVTGGAGFIGSAIATELNRRGLDDLIIVDVLDNSKKRQTLDTLKYRECLDREEFLQRVLARSLDGVQAIFHMGACSSTTERDEEFLRKNNFEYSRHLAEFALEKNLRFVYASSAATYGNGEQGYLDDKSQLEKLKPLNLYGQSKHNFDLWVKNNGHLDALVGLKYFNVFGPNEYHKGDMRSMVLKGFEQVQSTGKIQLFKSYKDEYADGGQVRDFLYIKDAVAMTLFFFDHPETAGIFNIGSGKARNWNDLAGSIFSALDKETHIEYIEMPEAIRGQYQYHTEAVMDKIRQAGCDRAVTPLEDAVKDYVQNYLVADEKRLAE